MNLLLEFLRKHFSNKKVLVVGSSKGIGKEAFLTFKSLGADVFGISRSEGIDISKKADIDKFFKKMSSIDFLINVAGINFCKKIEDISFEEWDNVLNTNLRSFFYIIDFYFHDLVIHQIYTYEI